MFHSPWGKSTPYTQKAQKNMNVSFCIYDKGDWNSWLPKGSRKNNFLSFGVEAPLWQGARTAHTPRYGKDEQRRQTRWIDAQT